MVARTLLRCGFISRSELLFSEEPKLSRKRKIPFTTKTRRSIWSDSRQLRMTKVIASFTSYNLNQGDIGWRIFSESFNIVSNGEYTAVWKAYISHYHTVKLNAALQQVNRSSISSVFVLVESKLHSLLEGADQGIIQLAPERGNVRLPVFNSEMRDA